MIVLYVVMGEFHLLCWSPSTTGSTPLENTFSTERTMQSEGDTIMYTVTEGGFTFLFYTEYITKQDSYGRKRKIGSQS